MTLEAAIPAPVPPAATTATAADTLGWGRHYLLCPPAHFAVDYAINPWMRSDAQPDPELAAGQFRTLVATLEGAGAQVSLIDPVEGLPDLVFTMNLGLVDTSTPRPRVVISRFRYPQRRPEADHARAWFTARGYEIVDIDAPDDQRFEPGDAFVQAGRLVYGHGFRSDAPAWEAVGAALGVHTLGLRLVSPLMYHLDLAFCPLDAEHALVVPDAFDAESLEALAEVVTEPVEISLDEAMTFCANSVVVGRTVVMPACPPRLERLLTDLGFAVAVVDVSEFLKGGGAVRCLTNPLDLTLQPARR